MSDTEDNGDHESDGFETFLRDARSRADAGHPLSVTIRDLLWRVGAERRGVRVVAQIDAALESHGLAAEPDLASGWVDNSVLLRRADVASIDGADPTQAEPARALSEAPEVSLTVRNLESAARGVVPVERTSDLARARALMLRHDYSQLAVISGPRRLIGAVSWESMALAAIRNPDFTLREATVAARRVEPDDDLIALIPTIVEKGFVFVVARDQTLAGIVTTTDLSLQFASLAGPFLLIGEIERRLRQTLDRCIPLADLRSVRDPADGDREIASAQDLTLGETVRIFEAPTNWNRLDWPIQRSEFVAALHEVREIRNDVMHFSPDPLSRSQEIALQNFVAWLRAMQPRAAATVVSDR